MMGVMYAIEVEMSGRKIKTRKRNNLTVKGIRVD